MTQLKQIENHLLEHGEITTWDAIKLYGITRLSKYIEDLRHQYGYTTIPDEWEHENGKQWKRYYFKTRPTT
jgi:hypothetical protein